MAVLGFEGFEKRLELRFPGDDPLGLRWASAAALEQVLSAVQCSIVSAAGNRFFDAYVLSESSLFVYPDRIIIKTCGTTRLLRSVPLFLRLASGLGLRLSSCRYTRGAFIFPEAQPRPHTSFLDEVLYLDECLPPELCYRKARVLAADDTCRESWHVYSASDRVAADISSDAVCTLEVCMTELDRSAAGKFFRRPEDLSDGHTAGMEMTRTAGIRDIVPRAVLCDHAFDPCGYSMNGLNRERYSTIHVTPEEGYSYASFECSAASEREVADVMRRVAAVFRPGRMSVAVTGGGSRKWSSVLEKVGFKCEFRTAEGFPGAGIVVYETFTAGLSEVGHQ